MAAPEQEQIEVRQTGLPLLRERRSGCEFHQAARSQMPQVFQQTLWISGTAAEGEGQEIVSPRGKKDRARNGSGLPVSVISIWQTSSADRSQGNEPDRALPPPRLARVASSVIFEPVARPQSD